MHSTIEDCARSILDVTPEIMRMIRTEMRSNRSPDLTVPQFRTLIYIRNHPIASLTDVAEHIGLTLSSTSKMVDGLVKRDLVTRSDSPNDRRRMTMELTVAGEDSLDTAVRSTQDRIGQVLTGLSESQRAQIITTMQLLSRLFVPDVPDKTD